MVRRNTIQRALVLDAVRRLHNHATAEEVYRMIVEEHPSVGKGTVYRNLSILADEGEILKIEIPDAADRFDDNVQTHYHLRCDGCGRIFDVDIEVPDLCQDVRDKADMDFQSFELLFRGLCSECRASK